MLEGAEESLQPLLNEAGGHRWQRVPPTERKGRVQTSTVTVAVFEVMAQSQFTLNERDIEVFTTKDSGPGGQHRNKTESCVVMRHAPTGIEAKSATKSQHDNRKLAREVLESRVRAFYADAQSAKDSEHRRRQVGSGQRGDKIRTYREQDNTVTDHASGCKARLSELRVGDFKKIFGYPKTIA